MIVLDSSFIVAFKIENDENHHKASNIMQKIADGVYGEPIISDYVFDEVITVVLVRSKKLFLAIEIGEELRESVKILRIDKSLFEEGWAVFKNQKNSGLSFTDCTIISLMKKNNIKDIATFDSKFIEVEGIAVVHH